MPYIRIKDQNGGALVVAEQTKEGKCFLKVDADYDFRPGQTYSLKTNEYHLLSNALPETVTIVFRGRLWNETTRFLSKDKAPTLFERPRIEMSWETYNACLNSQIKD